MLLWVTLGTLFVIRFQIPLILRVTCHQEIFFSGLDNPRYLVVLYHQRAKMAKKMDLEKKQKELERLKAKFGVDGLTGEN